MKHSFNHKKYVTTAFLLAAGTGSRLYPLTQNDSTLKIINIYQPDIFNMQSSNAVTSSLETTGILNDKQ